MRAVGNQPGHLQLSGNERSVTVTDAEILQEELYGETEMLLYGADPLLQPLDSFL